MEGLCFPSLDARGNLVSKTCLGEGEVGGAPGGGSERVRSRHFCLQSSTDRYTRVAWEEEGIDINMHTEPGCSWAGFFSWAGFAFFLELQIGRLMVHSWPVKVPFRLLTRLFLLLTRQRPRVWRDNIFIDPSRYLFDTSMPLSDRSRYNFDPSIPIFDRSTYMFVPSMPVIDPWMPIIDPSMTLLFLTRQGLFLTRQWLYYFRPVIISGWPVIISFWPVNDYVWPMNESHVFNPSRYIFDPSMLLFDPSRTLEPWPFFMTCVKFRDKNLAYVG